MNAHPYLVAMPRPYFPVARIGDLDVFDVDDSLVFPVFRRNGRLPGLEELQRCERLEDLYMTAGLDAAHLVLCLLPFCAMDGLEIEFSDPKIASALEAILPQIVNLVELIQQQSDSRILADIPGLDTVEWEK